jgi:hypothetical protein
VTAGRRALTPEHAELVAAFSDAIRADRGRGPTLDVARRRHAVLEGARRALVAAGEPLGAQMLAVLAEDAAATVADLEAEAAEAAEAAAERAQREDETLLRVACESENHAAHADGGGSTYGIAQWLVDVERWARDRC